MYRSRPDFAVHTKSSSPQRQLLVAANRSRNHDISRAEQSIFGREPQISEKDLKTNRRSIEALPRLTQDQVAAIIKSPQFQNWMASPTSEILFVNCNSQNSAQTGPSGFLCSKLVDSIDRESLNVVSLTFFCREHVRSDDPYHGATGMLENLIGQLVYKLPDLNFLGLTRRQKEEINLTDFLCGVLESLILELPANFIVFCVIEGINVNEEIESSYKDFKEAVETLVNIATRSRFGGCAFKLILLCPWNSHKLYKLMPDQERTVFWIPAKVSSQGGLTTAKWNSFLRINFQFLI